MDASKSHFMGMFWASIVIILFTVTATVIIVAWSPVLPEAIAVDINRDATDNFSQYMALHETESWHYTAALSDAAAIAYCPR